MKKLKLIIYILPFIIFSCNKMTSHKKAEKNITAYLLKYMNDPKSYESIEFGKLDTSVVSDYSYFLEHMYRGKNKLGALTVSKDVFLLDSEFNVMSSESFDEFSKYASVDATARAATETIDSAKWVADSTVAAISKEVDSIMNLDKNRKQK